MVDEQLPNLKLILKKLQKTMKKSGLSTQLRGDILEPPYTEAINLLFLGQSSGHRGCKGRIVNVFEELEKKGWELTRIKSDREFQYRCIYKANETVWFYLHISEKFHFLRKVGFQLKNSLYEVKIKIDMNKEFEKVMNRIDCLLDFSKEIEKIIQSFRLKVNKIEKMAIFYVKVAESIYGTEGLSGTAHLSDGQLTIAVSTNGSNWSKIRTWTLQVDPDTLDIYWHKKLMPVESFEKLLKNKRRKEKRNELRQGEG